MDLAPDADRGPQPWADPGNSVAHAALGVSVAAFGLLFFGPVGVLSLPLGIVGTILSVVARARIKREETRQGKVEAAVGLAVGIATVAITAVAVAVVLLTR